MDTPNKPQPPEVSPSSRSGGPSVFDHEKLDVYQLELRFVAWVTPLIEGARQSAAGKPREVCEQLDRASLSMLLNTAEGNGKRQRPVRAKFFDDARGSATECAACLDALVAKNLATPERIREGKAMLLRVVSMLCGLVEKFDTGYGFREEGAEERAFSEPVPVTGPVSYSRTRTRTSRNKRN